MIKYKNILVHALVNLGDVVLSTSAIALLKKVYPEARITMLVRPEVMDVVCHNPVIDDIIVFNYRSKHHSLGCMMTVIREIKSRRFDLAISFDQKQRPALICWLARIPTRVCSDINFDGNPSRIAWFYNKVVCIDKEFLHNNPQAESFQEIVRQLSNDNRHDVPVIPAPTTQSQETARTLLSVFPQNTKKIALCVKGTFPLKTWPKESFADLVHRLSHKYKASFFVIGAPGDCAYADEVIAAIGNIGGRVLNFCGKTSINELTALFGMTDLFVSVDTGSVHIASTTGIPMVTMIGCGNPKRWPPLNKNARLIVADIPCRPCSCPPEGCPTWPKPECQQLITVDNVFKNCCELLGES